MERIGPARPSFLKIEKFFFGDTWSYVILSKSEVSDSCLTAWYGVCGSRVCCARKFRAGNSLRPEPERPENFRGLTFGMVLTSFWGWTRLPTLLSFFWSWRLEVTEYGRLVNELLWCS